MRNTLSGRPCENATIGTVIVLGWRQMGSKTLTGDLWRKRITNYETVSGALRDCRIKLKKLAVHAMVGNCYLPWVDCSRFLGIALNNACMPSGLHRWMKVPEKFLEKRDAIRLQGISSGSLLRPLAANPSARNRIVTRLTLTWSCDTVIETKPNRHACVLWSLADVLPFLKGTRANCPKKKILRLMSNRRSSETH